MKSSKFTDLLEKLKGEIKNISKDGIKKFVMDNLRYVISIVGILLIIVILATCTSATSRKTVDPTAMDEQGLYESIKQPYMIDKFKDVNKVVEKYFDSAAKGDIETLKTVIAPFDEQQQNLIKKLSEYVEAYTNIKCYTKVGPIKDSYVVSVYHEVKFKDIDTVAPGVTTLYIHKNEQGNFYIDNTPESLLPENVIAYNQQFRTSEDVVELKTKVDKEASDALAKDAKLKTFVEGTYQQIYVDFYSDLAKAAEEKAAAEKKAAEEKAAAEQAAAEKKAAEEQAKKDAEERKNAKTVYANDEVNIRTAPSTDADIIDTTSIGQGLVYLKDYDDTWAELLVDDTKAYILKEYISMSEVTEGGVGSKVAVTDTLNIRSGKSADSDLVGSLFPGDEPTITEDSGDGWVGISCNGMSGYVMKEYLH